MKTAAQAFIIMLGTLILLTVAGIAIFNFYEERQKASREEICSVHLDHGTWASYRNCLDEED